MGRRCSAAALRTPASVEVSARSQKRANLGGAAGGFNSSCILARPLILTSVVFPAVTRFIATLQRLTGLQSHVGKFACCSPQHQLQTCPWRLDAGVPLGTGPTIGHGLMVGGVPIGDNAFVYDALLTKAYDVVNYVDTTAARLRDHPHALWASLYYCCQSRFDHWLRHCPPVHTRVPAGLVDDAILRAIAQMSYQGMTGDPITLQRLRLPARFRGCGIRSRRDLAEVAYVSCFAESAEVMIDRAAVAGGPRTLRGYFPALRATFGAGSFDPDGRRFEQLLQLDDSTSAGDFEEAWDSLRQRIQGSTVTGPLSAEADDAGRGTDRQLQHAITEQIEQVQRDTLHRDMLQLPRTDTRRIAWMSADRLSSQWVVSWPTRRLELSDLEFPEVISTYLGRESPLVRTRAGCMIPCGQWRGPRGAQTRGRICDPHGIELGLATLPGGSDTVCHDACSRELFDIVREAGLPIELQPAYIHLPHPCPGPGPRPGSPPCTRPPRSPPQHRTRLRDLCRSPRGCHRTTLAPTDRAPGCPMASVRRKDHPCWHRPLPLRPRRRGAEWGSAP